MTGVRKFYTPQQVADMMQFSKQTVLSWIKNGLLQSTRLGARTIRISQQQFDDFIERHRVMRK